jgi:uncharacterized protein (DUF111 family)
MTLEKTGAGAGTRDIPNAGMLRIIVGVSPLTGAPAPEMDEAILLETNIDDMDPRVYPYIMEQLLAAGVKDVWLTQVLMKKGRPGVLLSVLCDARQEQAAIQLIFREATTLGIRRLACPRYVLPRKMKGNRKVAELPGGKTKIA